MSAHYLPNIMVVEPEG